jgi:hypothetical protein
MNLCNPNCAASKMSYFANSEVTFSSPVHTTHGTLFSRLTVRYQMSGREQVFRFSYAGDPSFK